MTPRQVEELDLVRARFPDVRVMEEGGWVCLPAYPVPRGLWTAATTQVAFQVPESVGQEPYGFYVPRDLGLNDGTPIQNRTDGQTPFPGDWAKFSWNIAWSPGSDLKDGTTILDFVMSFAARFREGA